MAKFAVTYTIDIVIPDDWIWPNNDAPENPTAAEVESIIREDYGGWYYALQSWGFEDEGWGTVVKISE